MTNWMVSSDKPISERVASNIRDELFEWSKADDPKSVLVLQEGLVLHDLTTGKSYGSRIVMSLPEWAAVLGFLVGLTVGVIGGFGLWG